MSESRSVSSLERNGASRFRTISEHAHLVVVLSLPLAFALALALPFALASALASALALALLNTSPSSSIVYPDLHT